MMDRCLLLRQPIIASGWEAVTTAHLRCTVNQFLDGELSLKFEDFREWNAWLTLIVDGDYDNLSVCAKADRW